MPTNNFSADEIVAFWKTAGPDRWFKKDDTFDQQLRDRFLTAHETAAAGKLGDWETTVNGTLALLLLLDQFPRNMFRNNARAFATDPQALALAKRALGRSFDTRVEPELRTFFYLPFMHSEEMIEQERCVALYRAASDANGAKWAQMHADIIERFGRFPHRNQVLGRTTTTEEQTFLDGGGFAG
jgi:uncharacterized protein (DUF924 family)